MPPSSARVNMCDVIQSLLFFIASNANLDSTRTLSDASPLEIALCCHSMLMLGNGSELATSGGRGINYIGRLFFPAFRLFIEAQLLVMINVAVLFIIM